VDNCSDYSDTSVCVISGPTLKLDTRVSHAVLSECYHFNKQTSLDRDGRQCMSAGVTYSYCRLRPIPTDTDHFMQVAMGMKQWDCVSSVYDNFLSPSGGIGFAGFPWFRLCMSLWPGLFAHEVDVLSEMLGVCDR